MLQAELVKKFDWLAFVELPLDNHLAEAIHDMRWQDDALRFYNFHNFDRLLNDVSHLIDRCLSYRRDYAELSASAVRQALEYELFMRQFETSVALDLQGWNESGKAIDADTQHEASARFSSGTDSLTNGFAALAQGGETSARNAIKGEQERKELVRRHWENLRQYQIDLTNRHQEVGHVLNYREQASKILLLIVEDFKELYKKAFVASHGLCKLLGFPDSFPSNKDNEPLDSILHWTRTQLSYLDLFLECSRKSEIIVSIRDAHFVGRPGPPLLPPKPMIKEPLFTELDTVLTLPNNLGPAMLKLSFSPYSKDDGLRDYRFSFLELENILVQSIGFSLIMRDQKFADPSLLTAEVSVTLSDGGSLEHVQFKNVGVANTSGPAAMYDDAPFRNVDLTAKNLEVIIGLERIEYAYHNISASWADVFDVRIHVRGLDTRNFQVPAGI